MNLGRALTYFTQDPDWVGKLVIALALAFASVLLMPLLMAGLFPLCVLLGYMLNIAQNIRQKQTPTLPKWDNFAEWLSKGAGLLVALFVYNLPLVFLAGCISFLPGNFRDVTAQGFVTLTSLLCVLPLALVYMALAWPMLAAGTARYMQQDGKTRHLFESARLFEVTSSIRAESIQWLLIVLILNLASLLISVVLPCVGWIIVAALTFPVHGHLLGQYALLLDADHRRKVMALRKGR